MQTSVALKITLVSLKNILLSIKPENMRLKSFKPKASLWPKLQIIFLGMILKNMNKHIFKWKQLEYKIFVILDVHMLMFDTGEIVVNYD